MGKGLKCLFIRKIIQSGKAAYYINTTVWLSGKGKTMETVKLPVFASGQRVWRDDRSTEDFQNNETSV